MRLICPSCGAQYEVDESVIPANGRDVQCSNCGQAWFQRSAEQLRAEEKQQAESSDSAVDTPEEAVASEDADASEELVSTEDAGPSSDADVDAGVEQEEAETPIDDQDGEMLEPAEPDEAADHPGFDEEDAAIAEAADEAEIGGGTPDDIGEPEALSADEATDQDQIADPEDVADIDDTALEDETAVTSELKRKTLDDAVMGVLREEAERETQARVAEGEIIETQSDLGLASASAGAAAMPVSNEEQDRVARLRGDDDLDDDALVSRASRKELLPDIEEINSTLRATSERGDEAASVDAPETLRRRRSGFRRGFLTSMIIALLAVALYLLAPMLSGTIPSLEPALSAYVSFIDNLRASLDALMQSMTASLKGGAAA